MIELLSARVPFSVLAAFILFVASSQSGYFFDCLPNDWSFWNKFFLAISVFLGISVICCIAIAWIMLKPRLHERLNASANVVLFLSSNTRYSRALREEIDYAINTKGLPIIVVYPELSTKADIHTL